MGSVNMDCAKCARRIDGQFVRALNGHYHLDCFRCKDCNKIVAEKFFPLASASDPTATPDIYCETDYFAKLNLLCAKCGTALRGPHINALGKKYHLDHFTCSICSTSFKASDSYYERSGNVYCQFHYSVLFASKCGGCQTAVLKKFVEMNKENVVQQWHPECYMIYKLWNIKMCPKVENQTTLENMEPLDSEAEIKRQQMTLEKVSRILSVLSAFEESSAECIADMLIHFSNQQYQDGVLDAGLFIKHVTAIFSGIDSLELQLQQAGAGTAGPSGSSLLEYRREPRTLAKRIVHFFSLLSHSRGAAAGRKETTKEMITLVTSLANNLKYLIRSALNAALKLETKFNIHTAINSFLDKLVAINDTPLFADMKKFADYESGIRNDLCRVCQKSVEESCYKMGGICWHPACFTCQKCNKDLTLSGDARLDRATIKAYCSQHAPPGSIGGFERISQLEQFVFLLNCALVRLSILLNVSVTGEPGGSRQERVITMPNEVNIVKPTSLNEVSAAFQNGDDPGSSNLYDSRDLLNHRQGQRSITTLNNVDTNRYLSEQLALDRLSIRRQAVTLLEKYLGGFFSPAEFADFVNPPKQTIWSKMVGAMGTKKPPPTGKTDGTFGTPLETLVEKYGVDSEFGPGANLVRIPKFIDLCIRALKKTDLSTEGIFRKNGNLKRLKAAVEAFDQNPDSTDIGDDGPIQIAVLFKKFFRDLPEPLLTFKLHPLFIASQKITNNSDRKLVVHLLLCLLPKVNLDLLQVLLLFLRDVSLFCTTPNGGGNKMDISNLATVFAPNILYSKSNNPADDEAFVAKRVVEEILIQQDDFRLIPPPIILEIDANPDIGLRGYSNLNDRNRVEVSRGQIGQVEG